MRSRVAAGALAGFFAGVAYATVMHVMTAPMAMGGRERLIMMVADVFRSDSLAVAWLVLLATGLLPMRFGAAVGLGAYLLSGLLLGALFVALRRPASVD